MQLIADGVVDREGVTGLAKRLGYSERHLTRSLVAEVGAGPKELARAQRAQTSRVLIETTDISFTEVAFAAGFGSIRQFNDTVQEIFAATPTELRSKRGAGTTLAAGAISLRLAVRRPFAGPELLDYLAHRAVAGIEEVEGATYRRSLDLPHAPGVVELTPCDDHVAAVLRLSDIRDLTAAVQRCRRLLDLDADPEAVDQTLGSEELMSGLVARTPGRRVPGTVDGSELAFRAVLGQQVSVAAARTHAARLVIAHGKPLDAPVGGVTHLFPRAEDLLDVEPAALAMPQSRRNTIRELARAISSGDLGLDPGADRERTVQKLETVRGIGPWTAGYVRMRALGDPDAFMASDLGVHHALVKLGLAGDPKSAEQLSERWKPWRAYALQHLWASLTEKDETR